MNWSRVNAWDRVRGDRSDMELADERDERWFEREQERERRFAERAEDRRGAPKTPRRSKRTTEPKTKGSKPQTTDVKLSKHELAKRLGVTPKQLADAQRAETVASSGLAGLDKKERQRRAAARLRISPTELTRLRQVLGRQHTGLSRHDATLVRQVARTAPTTPPTEPKAGAQPARAKTSTGRATSPSSKTKSKKAKRKSSRSTGTSKPPGKDRTVYVTRWGNAVHLWSDCRNARGFRHQGEEDPLIYAVKPSDPCCRGRSVCGGCARGEGVTTAQVDRLLRKYHGRAFDESDWERYGWSRPMPTGEPVNVRASRK